MHNAALIKSAQRILVEPHPHTGAHHEREPATAGKAVQVVHRLIAILPQLHGQLPECLVLVVFLVPEEHTVHRRMVGQHSFVALAHHHVDFRIRVCLM